ncbi:hypothetical protein DMC64_18580 [Amycolatopsis sp. WAC 04197]|nr:hypothetical protein DMC64_18580 [Amycolatopsis sp. WAC 04197]
MQRVIGVDAGRSSEISCVQNAVIEQDQVVDVQLLRVGLRQHHQHPDPVFQRTVQRASHDSSTQVRRSSLAS